jgi:hypothetical protein
LEGEKRLVAWVAKYLSYRSKYRGDPFWQLPYYNFSGDVPASS